MKKILLATLCFCLALAGNAQKPREFADASAPRVQQKQAAVWPKAKKLATNVSGVLAASAKEAPAKVRRQANDILPNVVPDGENTVYAFIPYDFERWNQTHSFVKFRTDKPHHADMTKISDWDPRKGYDYWPEITAGTFVGKDLWVYLKQPFDLGYFYAMGFYKLDYLKEKFESTSETYSIVDDSYNYYKDVNVGYCMDASYDPTTGILWYVSPHTGNILFDSFGRAEYWQLMYIDTKSNDHFPQRLGDPLPICVSSIVADHGKLNGLGIRVENTGQVDEETGAEIWGVSSEYVEIIPNVANNDYKFNTIRKYSNEELCASAPIDNSSMELDRDNHRLYLTYTNLITSGVDYVELNPETGDIISRKEQGGAGFMVNSLAIPYQDCPDDAPCNVTDLSVVTGVNGNPVTTLSWKLPTKAYYPRRDLTDLQGIRVYRDQQLVAELGADATSYIDSDVPFGTYKYTIVPFNKAGEGLRESRTVFVGKDTPGAPSNVVLTAEGATATIAWDAPTIGAHGSWFDEATLAYDITRLPDNVKVATGVKGTTYKDVVPTTLGYSYTVTSVNAEGEGLSATSNTLSFGPALDLPFFSSLESEEDFNRWTVVDNNADGFKWQYNTYYGTIYDATFCGNKPSDYLMSPLFKTKTGQQYRLSYEVKVHNYKDTSEDFAWYNGNADAVPGDGLTRFEEGHYASEQGLKWFKREGIFTADDDVQRVAFSVRSEPLMGILYVRNVLVREYSETDLAAGVVHASDVGSINNALPITVSVVNKGSAAVSNYKVAVYDKDRNSYAETVVTEPILSEETADVVVNWTPKTAGEQVVYAEIIFDDDTYPADNISEPFTITVSEYDDDVWRGIGNKDFLGTNWVSLVQPYSQGQALYYANELQLKKGDQITGIAYCYEGNDEFADMKNVNFEVSLGNSNLLQIYDYYEYMYNWNYYPRLLKNSNFTSVCFFGFADINAPSGKDGLIEFPFQEPFTYTGGNLVVKLVRTKSTKVSTSNPRFYMQTLDDTWEASRDTNGRAVYIESTDDVADGVNCKGLGMNYLPVLYISYLDSEGIEHTKTVGNTNAPKYDLSGRHANQAEKGVFIQNGKKYVK